MNCGIYNFLFMTSTTFNLKLKNAHSIGYQPSLELSKRCLRQTSHLLAFCLEEIKCI